MARQNGLVAVVIAWLLVFSMASLAQALSSKELRSYAQKEIMAPDFTLKDTEGKEYSLKDYRGKMYVVLETGSST